MDNVLVAQNVYTMHVETQNVKSVIEPYFSGEALELLLGAGLDRVQAANLLAGMESSGQRPTVEDRGRDQRSSTRSADGNHQSAQTSQFEQTVLETLAKFGERLDSLTARVRAATPRV